jgi:hypothetical protein
VLDRILLCIIVLETSDKVTDRTTLASATRKKQLTLNQEQDMTIRLFGLYITKAEIFSL